MSRRRFLGALGTGAAASGTATALTGRTAHAQALRPGGPALREDRFGRMFPRLAPFAAPSARLQAALLEIGRPGGLLDARDALDRGPIDLILDPALSLNNPNSTTHTAGATFVGQFIDHDMTFDLTSRLGQPADPERSPNARTPALDLDSVYGGGPVASPELYERAPAEGRLDRRPRRPMKFKVESGGLFEDLPRAADGTAILADPRNDENLMVAGLHAAFLLFHNHAVDVLLADDRRASAESVFQEARRLTTWHYQWMVVHEFLPLFVGQAMVDDILARGRRYYRPEVGFIPVEFQGAAYRFG
ncbi:MAG TPA: peroxidase family protein, partial [Methylomirabilota bacterium]|nr:peroxidase family protein [Methylomirabilota bacterium]